MTRSTDNHYSFSKLQPGWFADVSLDDPIISHLRALIKHQNANREVGENRIYLRVRGRGSRTSEKAIIARMATWSPNYRKNIMKKWGIEAAKQVAKKQNSYDLPLEAAEYVSLFIARAWNTPKKG